MPTDVNKVLKTTCCKIEVLALAYSISFNKRPLLLLDFETVSCCAN